MGQPIRGGYYLKARVIQDSAIAHQPPHYREIWDWLLRNANHADRKVGGKTIKRGQLHCTIEDIREGLHWHIGYRTQKYSRTICENAMKWFRKTGMITTTKAERGAVVTICEYNFYQNQKNYESRTVPPQAESVAESVAEREKEETPAINESAKEKNLRKPNPQPNPQPNEVLQAVRRKEKGKYLLPTETAGENSCKNDTENSEQKSLVQIIEIERLENLRSKPEEKFNAFWLAYHDKFGRLPSWAWAEKETYRTMNKIMKEIFVGDKVIMLEAWRRYLDENSAFERQRGKKPRYFLLDIEKYRFKKSADPLVRKLICRNETCGQSFDGSPDGTCPHCGVVWKP